MVEHVPRDPKIVGLYPITGPCREKIANKLKKLRTVDVAQWSNNCLMIIRLRVRIPPLALGERKEQKNQCQLQ